MVATLLLISCLAVHGVSRSPRQPRIKKEKSAQDRCPPCELLFSKLEDTRGNGKLSQLVTVQERGEPKSGTGFMYFWGIASMIRTCRYLKQLYGEKPTWNLLDNLCAIAKMLLNSSPLSGKSRDTCLGGAFDGRGTTIMGVHS